MSLMGCVIACSLASCRAEGVLCGNCDAVLISIDTLRADHLGCYGYPRETSPNLDRLADDSILFERASSVSYHTAESHMAIFTALYPSVHGVRNASSATEATPLPAAIPTFVEALRERGFHTVGFHAGGNVSPTYGFGRGFDVYRWTNSDVAPAVEWVETQARTLDSRFFLFYHTYRTHDPYLPEAPLNRLWEIDYKGGVIDDAEAFTRQLKDPADFSERRDLFWRHVDRGRVEDVRKVVALYDGEIRQVDREVGRLIDAIGRLDRRVVVFLISDHGEEFLEHGRFLHDQAYEELLHVPWMVHVPGGPAGMRVAKPVSLIDLAPTLLEILGVDGPEGTQGRSLVPALEGKRDWRGSGIFAEKVTSFDPESGAPMGAKRALTRGREKLILMPDGRQELYDLESDPQERRNLIPDQQASAEALRGAMERLANANETLRRAFAKAREAPSSPLDDETLKQLRALGYLN